MLIRKDGTPASFEGAARYSFEACTHYVSGFFYIPGLRGGEESVNEAQRLMEETGAVPFDRMRGAFTYCIQKPEGETFLFACNSSMGCVYISDEAAGNRYLELLDELRAQGRALTFRPESVCEYCTVGKVFFNKTHVNEIAIVPNDSYVHWKDGVMEIVPKGIPLIDGESEGFEPRRYFHELAYALSEEKVSLSLTGGYDSRLVLSQLYREVPMKLFYSHNSDDDVESRIAKKIAGMIGFPFENYHTEKPALSEEYLRDMVLDSDGMIPLSLEGDERMRTFRRRLQAEGCTLQLTGDGGVMHKDWEWMQDLPFYRRKKTDLRRFYHQRVAYHLDDSFLGKRLKNLFAEQEDRFVREMQRYVRRVNTESYDMLYYYVSGDFRTGYNRNRTGYRAYSPLLETDMVRDSYHLPRRKRFFYNYVRMLTTDGAPQIARVPTNYGTTASDEPLYLLRDVFFQSLDYGRKGCRMISRKLFRRSIFVGQEIDWSAESELRALPLSREAVEWGVSCGYLSEASTEHSIKYSRLTHIVHLFLLKKEYGILA